MNGTDVKTELPDEFIIVDPKTEVDDDYDDNSNSEYVHFPETVEITAPTITQEPDEPESYDIIIERRQTDSGSIPSNGDSQKTILEKLPRPVHALNCRQARTYLVKLLRISNNGLNPQYGNPGSKPPFWPDYYWPWEKLTDVHTKPRGMEEPLLYSEMMKIAIERGYKFYGYDPDAHWDKSIEEAEPTPVVRGTPAPIQPTQVENLGLPPKLPRPLHLLNCVQARTVLSKLLRYQQAGNNPVYGHPDTQPPWWPDDCIRWIDMVDLRGKPPYLPKKMSYTDVLKRAIELGLQHFGYSPTTWVDDQAYNKEIVTSFNSRQNKPNIQTMKFDTIPKLPIPINKMNCGIARTSLARLLRYHCGTNPKYGDAASMPVWWPNSSFEWAKLKNLSHRFEGFMNDSYSNCLRLAVTCGYEYYGKDPMTFVEDSGDELPAVNNVHNATRRFSNSSPQTLSNTTPQTLNNITVIPALDGNLSELVKRLDGEIDSTIEKYKINQLKGLSEDENITLHQNETGLTTIELINGSLEMSPASPATNMIIGRKRPLPPLLPIAAVKTYAITGSIDVALLKDLGVVENFSNGVKILRTSES